MLTVPPGLTDVPSYMYVVPELCDMWWLWNFGVTLDNTEYGNCRRTFDDVTTPPRGSEATQNLSWWRSQHQMPNGKRKGGTSSKVSTVKVPPKTTSIEHNDRVLLRANTLLVEARKTRDWCLQFDGLLDNYERVCAAHTPIHPITHTAHTHIEPPRYHLHAHTLNSNR